MLEWSTSPLLSLCDQDRGITYGIVKVGAFVPDGIPVIRGGDIRENKIVFSEDKRVSIEVSNQFKRTILRGGEVLVNLISEPGHCAIVPDSLCGANISRDVGMIALGDNVNHHFVSYYLKSPQCIDWLTSRLQGSVTEKINLGTLKELPIPLPRLGEQAAIADTLMSLDDKIELNGRTNETLEAMVRSIFRDWFVDFGPTRAKMEGREQYLAPELWALFPDRIVDETSLPQGWEGKPLDEIAEFVNGLALQKFPASDNEDSLPVIKIAELRNGITKTSNRASRQLPEKYVVVDGDFLFSWSGSLMAKFWTEGEGALNQHLFKVTSDRYPAWFYSQWVYHHLEEFRAIAASKATTMGHIQREHLKAAITSCPPDDVLSKLGRTAAPLLEAAIKNELEARNLAKTRDLLLPKLMSGEIRLRDAEKIAVKVL